MRIAIGGFCHETNFFSDVTVSRAEMDASTREGETLVKGVTGAHSYLGGFVDEAMAQGVEVVGTYFMGRKPSGPCDPEGVAYAHERLPQLLREAYDKEPYDGIALFMHGGGSSEGFPDPEGTMLEAIREKMGADIPIGVVLDLHGNVTHRMVENSNLLMGCKHYPHIDEYDEGRTMFRLLVEKIRGGYPTYQKLVQLPWLMVPAEGVTTAGPAHDVQQMCMQHEKEDPDLLQASFFQGFPYADTPDCCVSIITVAKSQEAADRHALELARYTWGRRHDFTIPKYSAEQAVELALSMGEGPILINESSDNPGSGTPGDGTFLLRAMLEANVPSAFGFIYDPEVAQQAAKAGVGATISCKLGGKTDKLHGAPIELENARVKCISDGSFVRQSLMGLGGHNSLGTTVCLVVGNVEIVVGSFRTQTFDEGPFVTAGVTWRNKRLIALKSAQHFKGWWADKVSGIVACDSPGVGSADLTTFQFKLANTDYYPLKDAQWEG